MSLQKFVPADETNRIYVNTEFYDDGETIAPISVGAVDSLGRLFYAINGEIEYSMCSRWVQENVVPRIGHGTPVRKHRIGEKFRHWIEAGGGRHPVELWGDYPSYDRVVLGQLYGPLTDKPKVFPYGIYDVVQFAAMVGLDFDDVTEHPAAHNALEDAGEVRRMWAVCTVVHRHGERPRDLPELMQELRAEVGKGNGQTDEWMVQAVRLRIRGQFARPKVTATTIEAIRKLKEAIELIEKDRA